MSDPSSATISLTKQTDGSWLINDSFLARPDWIIFLLDGLEKQNASQMVPKSMHNSSIKQLAGASIKVQVFKGDKITNQFYVGKDPSVDNLTVMLNIRPDGTNAPRPFLVKHGFTNTFLGVRYKTDLDIWRDKRIFNFIKGDIQKIEVRYSKKPQQNFTVTYKPTPSIEPASDSTGKKLNMKRFEGYRGFYDKLFCMGFENDYILKDTFVKTFTPFATVTVYSTNNEQHEVSVYYRQVNKGTHNVLTIDGEEYDGDSFFGWYDKRDFVLLSSETAQKILREHREFFRDDTPAAKQQE